MATRIEIQRSAGVEELLATRVRRWTNEVLERKGLLAQPPYLCITIWKTLAELQSFYQREKHELGVVTGEEVEFLATHEAWRGYPRIHVCQERLKDVPDAVIQGALHHEMSHALHHGTPEFYTFRYSNELQEAGRTCGLDLTLLQQCVYLLSIAIKDHDVVTWLSNIGLGFSQLSLLEYMICDTAEEHQIWQVVRVNPARRKLALAYFLKILLPIEAMISVGVKKAEIAKSRWEEAYRWLPEETQAALAHFARDTMIDANKPFQQRLEHATSNLITDPSL